MTEGKGSGDLLQRPEVNTPIWYTSPLAEGRVFPEDRDRFIERGEEISTRTATSFADESYPGLNFRPSLKYLDVLHIFQVQGEDLVTLTAWFDLARSTRKEAEMNRILGTTSSAEWKPRLVTYAVFATVENPTSQQVQVIRALELIDKGCRLGIITERTGKNEAWVRGIQEQFRPETSLNNSPRLPDKIELILERYDPQNHAVSIQALVHSTGYPLAQIMRVLKEHNMPVPDPITYEKLTPSLTEQMIAMFKAGMNDKTIAFRLNLETIQVASQVRKEKGFAAASKIAKPKDLT